MQKVVDELINKMQDQLLCQQDLDMPTPGKPGPIPVQPGPFQHLPIRVQPFKLQPTWRRGFLLQQPRPMSVQPSRLQWILGKAGGGSGSSGAKPQKEGRNRGGGNRNQRNTQRYDGGNRGSSQRSNRGNDKGPAALTAQIKKAPTVKELLSTHRAHESHLDHIHLSACWTSLARQARQSFE